MLRSLEAMMTAPESISRCSCYICLVFRYVLVLLPYTRVLILLFSLCYSFIPSLKNDPCQQALTRTIALIMSLSQAVTNDTIRLKM